MAYRSLWGETRKPATAEQIATFKRAEHFASKGRKLDEFKGWDTVAFNGVGKTVIGTNDDCVVLCDTAIKKNNPELILIQTAEELQEVEHGEKV
ncbi:hypothetical protein [Candidatus Enterococcus lemimoniae]|uniref:Uncharacterized protein n=1 Tax=Candidatus Enterococcus lemimoniae TaxID=1834167 RepID=A0ABZ2T838_9ENTE|nr:hypothetical protein [Enterococcus sp. 12C11_DIV0727]OTO71071.1 hypothetical protein A5866_003321 [Enterococcus sp. 12C11_DIV0727]